MTTDEDGGGADPDGALADFNRAIKLNTNFAAAYRVRGQLEEGDKALADFSRAIELDPTNKLNYISRTYYWESHTNLDKAMADLDSAIKANPKDEMLFTRRAHLKLKMGDFSGMVADISLANEVFPPGPSDQFRQKLRLQSMSPYAINSGQILHRWLRMYDKAVEQNPNFYWGYYHRGVLEHLANDLERALADFRQCEEFSDAKLRDYAAIHIWLVQAQQHDRVTADHDLSVHFGDRLNKTQGDWEAQIARFLLDRNDETAFLAAAGVLDGERERSQVWFYTAMKQLLAGNKLQAANDFQKSRLTATRPYAVAISSQIELSYLGR